MLKNDKIWLALYSKPWNVEVIKTAPQLNLSDESDGKTKRKKKKLPILLYQASLNIDDSRKGFCFQSTFENLVFKLFTKILRIKN